jgi:hypothetical protein
MTSSIVQRLGTSVTSRWTTERLAEERNYSPGNKQETWLDLLKTFPASVVHSKHEHWYKFVVAPVRGIVLFNDAFNAVFAQNG